jgi:glyoxylase I family protein
VAADRPGSLSAIQHVALTVTDVEASVRWYQQVLGLDRVTELPHEGGFGVLLATPDLRVFVVLHHHDANDRQRFSEVRTGLDHLGFLVEDLAELTRWRAWFTAHDVTQSPITPLEDFDGSVLVFRDPDGIQLELYAPAAAAPG